MASRNWSASDTCGQKAGLRTVLRMVVDCLRDRRAPPEGGVRRWAAGLGFVGARPAP